MDSEQLVSNPFQEMQVAAMNECQKRASFTDKLTSVKNNVCEHQYNITAHQLEKEKSSKMRVLHNVSSKLRYDSKLLDIDKRKNDMEIKKRTEPGRDFAYDENQLTKSEKRLGVITDSYYLNKKLKHPIRHCSVKRLIPKTVMKAREALHERLSQEKAASEQSFTPRTSNTDESDSSLTNRRLRRRPSAKSAPSQGSAKYGNTDTNKLPQLNDNVLFIRSKKHPVDSLHVKFSEAGNNNDVFSLPNKIYPRAHSYHHDDERKSHFDFEDKAHYGNGYTDKVDLRALLFGQDKLSNGRKARSSYGDGLSAKKESKPVTQEMLKKESKELRQKIDTFLSNIPMMENGFITLPELDMSAIKNQTQNTIHEQYKGGNSTTVKGGNSPLSGNKFNHKDDSSSDEEENEFEGKQDSEKVKTKLWELIRGKQTNQRVGHQTPMDLMLQYMTGMIIDSNTRKTTSMPLNSASRAMRHTATFKMQKVVERMIEDRTRYKQHEIDVLKEKLERSPSCDSELQKRSTQISRLSHHTTTDKSV